MYVFNAIFNVIFINNSIMKMEDKGIEQKREFYVQN